MGMVAIAVDLPYYYTIYYMACLGVEETKLRRRATPPRPAPEIDRPAATGFANSTV